MFVAFYSNASLLIEELAKKIIDAELDGITISLMDIQGKLMKK